MAATSRLASAARQALLFLALVGLLSLALLAPAALLAQEAPSAAALYQTHCASCHGADRLGGQGPALLPENLGRLKPAEALKVIAEGRPATQMAPFGALLSPEQVKALADLIYTPLPQVPVWGPEQIQASRALYHPGPLPDQPKFQADIQNLFIVVELGDHHATLLDGDRFEPIYRFPTRFALHGGPKFAEGGRYVYFASRDGWISKFDIYNLTYVAETRAGINTRNLAVSHDGRFLLVANYLPHNLVVLDARDLSLVKLLPAQDKGGKTSRVSAVYTAAPRSSFIAAFKDIPEVWEIHYGQPPPKGFGGLVHDHNLESGDGAEPAPFPVRRIALKDFLDDFFLTQDCAQIIGTARDGSGQVVDLDLGRPLQKLDIGGMPHLTSGITWPRDGTVVLATPNIQAAKVTVLDTRTWQTIAEIPTLGPGFFMRGHEQSPYVWTDTFLGKDKDTLHVIDKQSLKLVKNLQPAPGKTAAHVEFTKDGRFALVSVWDPAGALVVYDAQTLEEVKRLPMNKPSGKYNVHNKLTRSAGTSH